MAIGMVSGLVLILSGTIAVVSGVTAAGLGVPFDIKDMKKIQSMLGEGYLSTDLGYGENHWTLLHIACYAGALDTVRMLVGTQSTPIDYRLDESGDTALILAAKRGKFDISRLLLTEGANPNTRGIKGKTALHHVAANDISTIAYLLLKHHSIDMNLADDMGDTALHHASRSGSIATLAAILTIDKSILNLDAVNSNGHTPLFLGVFAMYSDVVARLLKAGSDPDIVTGNTTPFGGITALHQAISSNLEDVIANLLVYRANTNIPSTIDSIYPLHLAVLSRNVELINILVEYGAIVDCLASGNLTPLHIAALNGFEHIARALYCHGADNTLETTSGITPLQSASNNPDIARAFRTLPEYTITLDPIPLEDQSRILDDPDCAICRHDLLDGTALVKLHNGDEQTPHYFHQTCLNHWTRVGGNNCPMDRVEFRPF